MTRRLGSGGSGECRLGFGADDHLQSEQVWLATLLVVSYFVGDCHGSYEPAGVRGLSFQAGGQTLSQGPRSSLRRLCRVREEGHPLITRAEVEKLAAVHAPERTSLSLYPTVPLTGRSGAACSPMGLLEVFSLPLA